MNVMKLAINPIILKCLKQIKWRVPINKWTLVEMRITWVPSPHNHHTMANTMANGDAHNTTTRHQLLAPKLI